MLIKCIGEECEETGRGAVSYSRPYHFLRERCVKLGFKRFKRVVRSAENAGLLLVLPSLSDIGGATPRKKGGRGRSAERFLVLTEKGEKLYELLKSGCPYGRNCGLDWIFERVLEPFRRHGPPLRGVSQRQRSLWREGEA